MSEEWTYLQQTGILRKKIIAHIWREMNVENCEDVLELLEKLDLICKIPEVRHVSSCNFKIVYIALTLKIRTIITMIIIINA